MIPAALACYEIIFTLRSELLVIWGGKRNVPAALYVLNRYIFIAGYCVQLQPLISQNSTPELYVFEFFFKKKTPPLMV